MAIHHKIKVKITASDFVAKYQITLVYWIYYIKFIKAYLLENKLSFRIPFLSILLPKNHCGITQR